MYRKTGNFDEFGKFQTNRQIQFKAISKISASHHINCRRSTGQVLAILDNS